MDETLIYATEERLERECDFTVGQYFIYKRPFVESFLRFCFENFDVAVWTTATKSYAEEIFKNLLKENEVLQFLWTREQCTYEFDEELREPILVKKLAKVRRRKQKLDSVIVVDDSPNVWRSSYGNLICVNKFEGEKTDKELKILPIYLEKLKDAENIRSIEKRNWRRNIR